MTISMIVAYSESTRVIGNENKLLWHIPEDLKFFRRMTEGKVVVMGRKTYESIPEQFRPLPKRTTYVLTRDENYAVDHPDVTVFNDVKKALMVAKLSCEEVMIAGGEQIYRAALPYADKVYATIINERYEGDAVFPVLNPYEWKCSEREANQHVSEQLELFYVRQTFYRQ